MDQEPIALFPKSLESWKIILAMVNGMLGGYIFSIPIFSYDAGCYYCIFAIIVAALANYYSSYLYVSHMSGELEVDGMISIHFKS